MNKFRDGESNPVNCWSHTCIFRNENFFQILIIAIPDTVTIAQELSDKKCLTLGFEGLCF